MNELCLFCTICTGIIKIGKKMKKNKDRILIEGEKGWTKPNVLANKQQNWAKISASVCYGSKIKAFDSQPENLSLKYEEDIARNDLRERRGIGKVSKGLRKLNAKHKIMPRER